MNDTEAIAVIFDTYAIDATGADLDRLVDIGRIVGCRVPRDGAAHTRQDALDAALVLLRTDAARRVERHP